MGRGREPLRAVGPAAALDTIERNGQLRVRLGEDRPLENSVLLRADELFALVEEDEFIERVYDVQRLDNAMFIDFVDLEPVRDRLVEADVLDGQLCG